MPNSQPCISFKGDHLVLRDPHLKNIRRKNVFLSNLNILKMSHVFLYVDIYIYMFMEGLYSRGYCITSMSAEIFEYIYIYTGAINATTFSVHNLIIQIISAID